MREARRARYGKKTGAFVHCTMFPTLTVDLSSLSELMQSTSSTVGVTNRNISLKWCQPPYFHKHTTSITRILHTQGSPDLILDPESHRRSRLSTVIFSLLKKAHSSIRNAEGRNANAILDCKDCRIQACVACFEPRGERTVIKYGVVDG